MIAESFRRLFFAVALVASFTGSAVAGPVDGFAQLPATDVLRVRAVSSLCCAGTLVQEFVFRGGDAPTLSGALIEREFSAEKVEYLDASRDELGQTLVSPAERLGLDEYLRLCRADQPRECARVIQLTFSQEREGKVVASEIVWDNACEPSFPAGVTSFWDLLARFEKRP